MKNNIALIIDTNFNYSDVWPPCFGRLDKYASGIKKYAFTDKSDGMPEDITPVYYDNSVSYRNQFLSCIEKIEEQYVIYTSEDYYLYDFVFLPLSSSSIPAPMFSDSSFYLSFSISSFSFTRVFASSDLSFWFS